MKKIDKKILIISHNPLSKVNNNGKTLVSIFEGVPKENVYQIYLNDDIPDCSECCHYLQLNEIQILRSFFGRKNICCQEVEPTPDEISSASVKIGAFAINVKRLIRECIWKLPSWKEKLNKWMSDKKFDVVFFMAGDGLFAYDVYRYIINNTSGKACLFFTDDYVIGKTSLSPLARFRQYLLKRKIKLTLPITKELFVISDEMRKAYNELFSMDSYIIRNFSVERKIDDNENYNTNSSDILNITYAGGLHYNRWKVLALIADTLNRINSSSEKKCFLNIYSSQKISDKIIDRINIEGASKFCGVASASQIADVYSKADILLHVESFEKKSIASTKYSFSTKIPEYLSAGKCVLAVGPSEVASVQYLSKFACVINKQDNVFDILEILIKNSEYRESIRLNCIKHYEKDFSRAKQKECLEQILTV